jgi:AraC family transcriptional regulator of adaptative response/methylated-DNA-[protein]-cysteine methyltransferase
MSDYERIARAITFITAQVNKQPTLDEVAAHLHMSPYHFQRLFRRWAGVTPKRFLQVLTLDRAKQLLNEAKPLLDVSAPLGLSGGSRLYDHLVQLEAVTPGEFKHKGAGLTIEYGVHDTPFGKAFVAVTHRGICNLAFPAETNIAQQLSKLSADWPHAVLVENPQRTRAILQALFGHQKSSAGPLSLYVRGTNFQVNVWRALLRIPPAGVASYRQVAEAMGRPSSARAVGLANAANPVAFIIPCHRVIRQCGELGGYHWGETRKHAMHAWETARSE